MNRDHSRRAAIARITAGAAVLAGAPAVLRGRFRLFAQQGPEYSARAIRLVEETVVVDMLNQFRFADFSERPPRNIRWLTVPGAFTREDYEPYRTSGLRVIALGSGPSTYEASVKFFADWNGFVAGYDEWLMRIDDARDFARVKASGRVGVMLTCQTADHFRTPDDVATFYGLGQRVSQLTYNAATRTGSGFLADTDSGLTEFGAAIIRRMHEVGMVPDLSHCGDRTTLDALAAATKPVIISHGSCRALVPGHLRAKTDEMIRKVATSGGAIGIAFLRFVIRNEEPVTIEHVLDHFDHVARLVGVEHVGIGSDVDILGNPAAVGGTSLPSDQPNFDRYKVHRDTDGRTSIKRLDHPRRVFDLTEGLIRRRYSDADIKLILGGNWVRVMGSVWT